MKVNELANDGLSVKINFHFEKEDYAEGRKKNLNRYRRNADIRGFRKGMAPMGLIEKLYGTQSTAEAINSQISEGLNKYIEDNNLTVIGEPLPIEDPESKNNFETGEVFDFAFEIALAPKFELNITAEDKIPYYEVEINAAEKKEYKKNLYKQYAKLENCDVVKEEDFIVADLTQGDRKVEGTYIALNVLGKETKELFLGKKAGEEMDIDVTVHFPNETDRAAMLRIKKEELAETEAVWHLVIKEVKNYVDAVEGEEFYNAVFGPGKVTTDKEFDAAVAERMAEEFKMESDYRFMLDAREYLINKADIKVSEDFLKRWLLVANEGKFTMEDIEKEWPMFIKDFKWQTIEGRIMTDNKLEVKKENVEAQAAKFAKYQFAMYGLSNVPEEHLKGYIDMMLKDEKQLRPILEKAQEEVVLNFVRSTATLETTKITSKKLREKNQ